MFSTRFPSKFLTARSPSPGLSYTPVALLALPAARMLPNHGTGIQGYRDTGVPGYPLPVGTKVAVAGKGRRRGEGGMLLP